MNKTKVTCDGNPLLILKIMSLLWTSALYSFYIAGNELSSSYNFLGLLCFILLDFVPGVVVRGGIKAGLHCTT